MTKPQRLIRAGDLITAKGHSGTWKVTRTRNVGRGTQITATSLNAYPRVDLTIPESRATLVNQN